MQFDSMVQHRHINFNANFPRYGCTVFYKCIQCDNVAYYEYGSNKSVAHAEELYQRAVADDAIEEMLHD